MFDTTTCKYTPGQVVVIKAAPSHCLIPGSLARVDAALERPDADGNDLYRVTGIRANLRGEVLRAVQCLKASELAPLDPIK